jgi:putative membrane protein
MLRRHETNDADFLKGLVAGVAGGLFASLVMEQFQALWTKVGRKLQESEGDAQTKRKAKPTTVKVADAISTQMFGHKVQKRKQKVAGEAVHYAMGATSGAIYGAMAEVTPLVTAGEGLAFGTAVWALADEASLPALGLTKSPTKIPLSTHVYALASHFVYGAVTEAVRRVVRKAL